MTGWNNATGHIAMFNGRAYREPAHDNYSVMPVGSVRTVKGEF